MEESLTGGIGSSVEHKEGVSEKLHHTHQLTPLLASGRPASPRQNGPAPPVSATQKPSRLEAHPPGDLQPTEKCSPATLFLVVIVTSYP